MLFAKSRKGCMTVLHEDWQGCLPHREARDTAGAGSDPCSSGGDCCAGEGSDYLRAAPIGEDACGTRASNRSGTVYSLRDDSAVSEAHGDRREAAWPQEEAGSAARAPGGATAQAGADRPLRN